jgi:hypothetical protein
MRIPLTCKGLVLGWLCAGAAASEAQTSPVPDLASTLRAARHELVVDRRGLSGEGAALIRTGVAEARYVAIGEDHFTREIPVFAAAVCDLMAPQGLAAYVVEAGPVGTERIAPMLAAPDREARVAAFARAYPNAVAFIDGAEENTAAAHCRRTTGGGFRLIGVDQEFLGATGFLLDEILKSRLSGAARRQIERLRDEDKRANIEAADTGDPGRLLIYGLDPTRLSQVEAALRKGGDARALRLFAELKASHDIYALDRAGSPRANEERARLLKRHLVQALPAKGKVLLKFGDWHLYKGFNPLGQRDVGNFIAERADGEGGRSLHILVLPVKGTHGQFGGYGRQARAQRFTMSEDKDYRWFQIAADNRLAEGWTLFDLRRLRHRRIEGVDADWRRVIDGYDLMVVIPEAKAAKIIGY